MLLSNNSTFIRTELGYSPTYKSIIILDMLDYCNSLYNAIIKPKLKTLKIQNSIARAIIKLPGKIKLNLYIKKYISQLLGAHLYIAHAQKSYFQAPPPVEPCTFHGPPLCIGKN